MVEEHPHCYPDQLPLPYYMECQTSQNNQQEGYQKESSSHRQKYVTLKSPYDRNGTTYHRCSLCKSTTSCHTYVYDKGERLLIHLRRGLKLDGIIF